MTAIAVLHIAVTLVLIPVLVIVIRRPTRRWRRGSLGKALSVAGVLFISWHVGPVPVPLGAIVALARHRRNRPDTAAVPLADRYPGA